MDETSNQLGIEDAAGVPNICHPAYPWYVLRCFSNHERSVQQRLHDLRIDEFLPTQVLVKRWSDRIKKTERPLFPGYLFVRAESIVPVLTVPGACGLLGGNLKPAVISETEIESVRTLVKSLLPVEPVILSPDAFTKGDRVQVLTGPLKGCTGIVERHARGTRFIVTVELLMRGVAVEIDAGVLSK